MKIFAPLRDVEHVIPLAEAGADEFYCGFIHNEWYEKFGKEVEINRRSFCGDSANFIELSKLAQAIKIAHSYDKNVLLALNHHQFTNGQLDDVYKVIIDFKDIDGDGVILADLNAIKYAKKLGLFVASSTDLNVYNIDGVKYMQDMGVNRVIISRDILMSDIKALKDAAPNVEIETFMINGPCKFSDNLCLPLHSTKHGAFCRFLSQSSYIPCSFDGDKLSDKIAENINETYKLYLNDYMNRSCGLCAIWKLMSINVDVCKVVGRVLPIERVVKEVRLVKDNIEIAKNCKTEDEFLEKMIKPFSKEECACGYQCFYSDKKYFLR